MTYQQPQQQVQYAPPQPTPASPKGLAIAALITGIAAFFMGWVPILGIIAGIAAVALGVAALIKHQSKGMSITGLILGAIALLTSVVMTIMFATAGNELAKSVDDLDKAIEEVQPEPTEVEEAVEEAEPETEPEPTVPTEYNSALRQAQRYSDLLHMSKLGLYDQLTSEHGGQFSDEAAQYAVDNVDADWNDNALQSARNYQDTLAMSPAAIYDQLVSEYGGQFTEEQAQYAIDHLE